MIEPTETESKATLDAFAEALGPHRRESRPSTLHDAPHTHADQPARRGAAAAAAGVDVEDARHDALTNAAAASTRPAPAHGTWRSTRCCWNGGGRAGRCCWRFYQWREPTLSLGYFQEYAGSLASCGQPRCVPSCGD